MRLTRLCGRQVRGTVMKLSECSGMTHEIDKVMPERMYAASRMFQGSAVSLEAYASLKQQAFSSFVKADGRAQQRAPSHFRSLVRAYARRPHRNNP